MEHWIYTLNIAGHSVSLNMDTLITMWLTMIMLIIIALAATKNASIIPGKLQLVSEGIIKYFTQVTESSMGKNEAAKHLPLILTLFMFILTANLVGQLPWHLIHLHSGELASPNNDINMTAAMAIVVSIYYIYYGVKKKGFHFFFHGFGADGIIITLVDALELFVRPFSLALRLFANILAGEVLIFTMVGLLSYFGPLPFMLFELFVAVIQALVFTLLATTYISMAIKEE
ncbi:F0F1 ATP synthase subunit A [Spirochaetes bacterium]|uniref:ATP synthase subunit a n=1 Tax=Candidatus Scatousia excrementipullorum TaxID=2840936 RepID=A0A9D9DSL7_9BACT|nr:F0F1 ATP synthase subunit A [Candidatus Scatousia excrementipullorum]